MAEEEETKSSDTTHPQHKIFLGAGVNNSNTFIPLVYFLYFATFSRALLFLVVDIPRSASANRIGVQSAFVSLVTRHLYNFWLLKAYLYLFQLPLLQYATQRAHLTTAFPGKSDRHACCRLICFKNVVLVFSFTSTKAANTAIVYKRGDNKRSNVGWCTLHWLQVWVVEYHVGRITTEGFCFMVLINMCFKRYLFMHGQPCASSNLRVNKGLWNTQHVLLPHICCYGIASALGIHVTLLRGSLMVPLVTESWCVLLYLYSMLKHEGMARLCDHEVSLEDDGSFGWAYTRRYRCGKRIKAAMTAKHDGWR